MSRPLADPVFDIGRDLQRAYEEGYKQGRYDEKVETEMSLPKWIPCSERLPDKEERVLVTVWGDAYVAWRDKYGIWESDEYLYEKDDITAWMPLPKAYEGDKE